MTTTAFNGRRAGQTAIRDDRMPHGPDLSYHPFTFMHHTNDQGGWTLGKVKDAAGRPVLDENGNESWTVLPVLKPFYHRPGVAGVRTGARGSGRADIAVAMTRHLERGWVFLPWDAFPGGYVVEYEGVRGPVFLDVFTEPHRMNRSKPITICSYDTPGCPAQEEEGISWDQWRASLVESGAIPGPSVHAIDRLIRVQTHRSERLIKDVHIPHVAQKVETELRRLDTLESLMTHIQDSVLSVRKGKRRNKAPK